MGVYIKGMEMPKNCKECFACKAELSPEKKVIYVCCFAQTDCPLIPVPPHGDLIDRDALEQEAQKRLLMCNKNDNYFQKPYEVMRAITLAPTIIPADEEDEMDSFIHIFKEDDDEDEMDSFIRFFKD